MKLSYAVCLACCVVLGACKQPSGGRSRASGSAPSGFAKKDAGQSSDAKPGSDGDSHDDETPSTSGPLPELDSPSNATSQPTSDDFEDFLDEDGAVGPGKFVTDFRTSADFFTNMTTMHEGLSPHGWVRIWYSRNLAPLINRPAFTAPVGSVAIQRFQNADQSGYVVMVKKPQGFDSANGDWHYEVRGESGELLDAPPPGKNAACSGCHAAAEAKDYLAGTEIGFDPEDFDQGDGGSNTVDPDATTADPNAPRGPGVFRTDFANSPAFFTATPTPIFGKSPHGLVRVWYSSNLKDMVNNAKLVAPVGTVAIKEFDNDGRPGVDGVAVMIKKDKGYDTDRHDWYYEMRDTWGTLLKDPAPGKIGSCANCHAAAQATDFLAATKLDKTSGGGGEGPGKFKSDYATSTDFFSKMTTMGKEEGAHGATRIWYSVNARPVLGQANTTLPAGTVAIARYKNGVDMGIVSMIKVKDSDPTNGDWRYEMRDRYGNLLWNPRPGRIPECIACHKQAAATDYFKGTSLDN